MSNPHQSPAFDPKQFQDQPGMAPQASDHGWVGQVQTFAIFSGLQGVLEIVMGSLLTGVGIMMPALLSLPQAKAEGEAGNAPPVELMWIAGGIYFAIGLPALASGILRVVAAWKNYRFQGRVLSLVSIIAGMSTVLSCYCAPTALALLVYGLIIHLSPSVKAAFEMAKNGHSVDQILAAFNPYAARYYTAAGGVPAAGPAPMAGENPFGAR